MNRHPFNFFGLLTEEALISTSFELWMGQMIVCILESFVRDRMGSLPLMRMAHLSGSAKTARPFEIV